MKNKVSRLFLNAALVMLVACFSACGVYSFSGASIPADTQTITLRYFPNRSAQVVPALEQVLNEKLQDKFIAETGLEQVDLNGDLEFSGNIVTYSVSPAAAASGDQAALSRLTIAVKVDFINRLTDENWTDTFRRFEDFDRNQNLQDVEDELIDQITRQLVDDIFNKALVNW